MSNPDQLELEGSIIYVAERIPISDSPVTWLNSPELEEFIDQFFQLADFYRRHVKEDLVKKIDFRIVQTYLRITRMLVDVLRATEFADYHERADELLESLQNAMDEVTTAGFTKLAREESDASRSNDID